MQKTYVVILIFFFSIILNISISFADNFVYDLVKSEKRSTGNVDSLKKQLANGASNNEIICKGFADYLIYKIFDGSPVCVNEFHVGKLVTREWATLGNSSLVITTDKPEYRLGEPVIITMENNGDTRLFFNCQPDFSLVHEKYGYVDLSLDVIVPPCESLFYFEPLSRTTLIWHQYTLQGGISQPGNFGIVTNYLYPQIDENGEYVYLGKTQTANFTIMSK